MIGIARAGLNAGATKQGVDSQKLSTPFTVPSDDAAMASVRPEDREAL